MKTKLGIKPKRLTCFILFFSYIGNKLQVLKKHSSKSGRQEAQAKNCFFEPKHFTLMKMLQNRTVIENGKKYYLLKKTIKNNAKKKNLQ